MNTSPYARKTESIEAVIANVYRAACDDPAARDEADQLVRAAAAEAVAYYWPRPVRTFIPVLALRDVRASLHGVPTRSASGDPRPLSIVIAARRFVATWPGVVSGDPGFRQAAWAAADWCGTAPERVAARSAFYQVANALCADGSAVPFDAARYVVVAAEMLAAADITDEADSDPEDAPESYGAGPAAQLPAQEEA
ncbi:MAG TPA: hypothetical protein VEQ36_15020 [Thermomicrobiales bacterium]|nr:hypothetical protein [Thermomicrobiales bacterium]